MIAYYKAKFFSLVGSADILAENKEDVLYKVKGKFFTLTAKKKIYDAEGKLIYRIRDKFWHLFHKRAFIMDADGNKIARVTRKLFTFHENFTVEGFNQDVRVDGDLIGLRFKVFVDDKQIGDISFDSILKRQIVCDDPEDLPFLVALLTAIYNIISHKHRDR